MQNKYAFTKISVRPAVKREIDVFAAMQQRPVYELVGEMLEAWKAAQPGSEIPAGEPADDNISPARMGGE